jgi:hypothetical protein
VPCTHPVKPKRSGLLIYCAVGSQLGIAFGAIHHTAGAFWVADCPQSFKRAILDSLSDDEEARRRAAQARAIFDRTYSLAANMQALKQVIAGAALNHARRTGTQYQVAE